MQFQIGMQNFFIKVGIKTVFSLVSALSALLWSRIVFSYDSCEQKWQKA